MVRLLKVNFKLTLKQILDNLNLLRTTLGLNIILNRI